MNASSSNHTILANVIEPKDINFIVEPKIEI
jgi:hypothetical protein